MPSECEKLVEEMLQAFYADEHGLGEASDMERALAVAEAAIRAEEREACAKVAEVQPYYPDTHTGMRQQWVKDQIAAAIRAREMLPMPSERERLIEEVAIAILRERYRVPDDEEWTEHNLAVMHQVPKHLDQAKVEAKAALAIAEANIRADEREACAQAAHEAWLDGVSPAEVADTIRNRQ